MLCELNFSKSIFTIKSATKMKKILIPIDFEDATHKGLEYGISMLKNITYELHLLHLINSESERLTAQKKMDNLIHSQRTEVREKLIPRVLKGKIELDITKTAETIDASFILMGTHENKRINKIIGSKAIKVVSESKIPFITIQASCAIDKIDKIALTIDLEKESVQIVKAAIDLAKEFSSEITIIGGDHSDPGLKSKVAINIKTTKKLLSNSGIKYTVELLERKNFLDNLIVYCKENNIDMIAATYYPDTFTVFSTKFVQKLLENEAGIPVLTFDAQAVTKGTQYSFMSI
jgi:nucleotide-binding universal stress UspA family protein